ncbi:hypothetical protein KDH_63160 [Dictyobacter sp. S3.2.2.5]|uniref:Uncharacterized protein n=1 Tax=Dictyobacter halimunensis TaxID=3026934 RepID=A0ABQ6G063_9CHLR|nr:hypothetical protein KDH_63160 [Dictyobacter sp. S3.2.2.5]
MWLCGGYPPHNHTPPSFYTRAAAYADARALALNSPIKKEQIISFS